jgi:hypothetical protein
MMKSINTKGWKRADFIDFYLNTWQCPVVPVADTKKPMVQWTKYSNTMPTAQELKDWFDLPCRAFKQPPWGIAIVLKNNLFSLDIDLDHMFTNFKEQGAFPTGACIYKSARGYHVIMRSRDIVPYTVKEHDPVLIAINPDFDELGIGGGNNHLSNMPDTPGRKWLDLYEQPIAVDYNGWLAKNLGWTKDDPYKRSAGWQEEIMCPWHEWGTQRDDGREHTPSLRCNTETGGFECHGCPEHGTFTKLAEKAKEVGMPLPQYVADWLTKFHERATGGEQLVVDPGPIPSTPIIFSANEEFEFEELPPGLVDGILWRGDVGTIFAPAGAGKTSVIISAAGDIVLGREMWGMDGWQPQKGLRILILDLENRPGETRAAIRRATDRDGNLKNLFVAELEGLGFDIYDPKWVDWLEEQLTKLKVDILVVDNLNKYTSSNVVDPFEMKKVVAINRRLARKYDIAVFAIHHTGHLKTGEDGEFQDVRPAGGAAIRDDANFEFQVLRIKSKKNQVRVTCTKMRSRVSKVRTGDEFILRYDEETTRMYPAGNEYLRAELNLIVEKFGRNKAAELLGISGPAMSNWTHGTREPKGEYKQRIEELCKKEGLVPRVTDL